MITRKCIQKLLVKYKNGKMKTYLFPLHLDPCWKTDSINFWLLEVGPQFPVQIKPHLILLRGELLSSCSCNRSTTLIGLKIYYRSIFNEKKQAVMEEKILFNILMGQLCTTDINFQYQRPTFQREHGTTHWEDINIHIFPFANPLISIPKCIHYILFLQATIPVIVLSVLSTACWLLDPFDYRPAFTNYLPASHSLKLWLIKQFNHFVVNQKCKIPKIKRTFCPHGLTNMVLFCELWILTQ